MAEDETGEVPKLPPDARLESLDRRLDRMQEAEQLRDKKAQGDPNTKIAQLVVGQLIGAPAGGFLIGLGLDSLFRTRPIFMLLFLFVGFGVGFRNLMRISKTPSGPGPGAS
jgi:ATP synthase protein I